jgi:hypothetical protein
MPTSGAFELRRADGVRTGDREHPVTRRRATLTCRRPFLYREPIRGHARIFYVGDQVDRADPIAR